MSICGDTFSLFQVEINETQLNNWYPLESTCINKNNCGPTALALTNIICRSTAERYSVEEILQQGITIELFTQLMIHSIPRLEICASPMIPINNMFHVLQFHLLPGNITIVSLIKLVYTKTNTEIIGNEGHITTIAKDKYGQLFIFEGQDQNVFIGNQIDIYLLQYSHFSYWCSNMKLKRKLSDIINIALETGSKKPKISGGTRKCSKKRKKRKKYKKTCKSKKCKSKNRSLNQK